MYAFTQDLPITAEIWFRLKEGIGPEPIRGLLLHVVTRQGGGLRYIDVWESKEACDRFLDERVHPVLQAAFAGPGGQIPPEPPRDELDVVDVMRP
jgi:hypothetical protein